MDVCDATSEPKTPSASSRTFEWRDRQTRGPQQWQTVPEKVTAQKGKKASSARSQSLPPPDRKKRRKASSIDDYDTTEETTSENEPQAETLRSQATTRDNSVEPKECDDGVSVLSGYQWVELNLAMNPSERTLKWRRFAQEVQWEMETPDD